MSIIGDQTNQPTNFTANGYVAACRFQAPASGDANPGTFYVYCYYGTTQGHLKLGVWADSSGYPGALLASGPLITCPSTVGWESGAITWTGITSGTYYWLGLIGENVATQRARYGSGAANQSRYIANTGYPTLPDPFPGSATGAAASFAAYIDYTASASATVGPLVRIGGTNGKLIGGRLIL